MQLNAEEKEITWGRGSVPDRRGPSRRAPLRRGPSRRRENRRRWRRGDRRRRSSDRHAVVRRASSGFADEPFLTSLASVAFRVVAAVDAPARLWVADVRVTVTFAWNAESQKPVGGATVNGRCGCTFVFVH